MNDPSTPSSEVSAKRANDIIDGAPQPESRIQEEPIAGEQQATTAMEDPGPVPTADKAHSEPPRNPPPGKGESKTARAQFGGAATKSGRAFSVREEDWKESIPKPGHYDAIVSFASINPKSDICYLNLDYKIVDASGRPFVITEMTVLDAKATNSRYLQSAEGRGRVNAIMQINGKPLEFDGIQAVPLALMGCRMKIAVGYKYHDGLPAPTVQRIVGPAEPEKEKP